MTAEIRTINLILVVMGLAFAIVGLFQVLLSRNIEKKSRYFLFVLFLILNAYVSCILIRELTHSFSGDLLWMRLSQAVLFGQALFASILAVLVTAFLLYSGGVVRWLYSRIFVIALIFWLCYVVLLIVNLFTGIIYRVGSDNSYSRGPLFSMIVIPTALIMGLNLLAVFLYRKRLTVKQRKAFVIYSIFPLIAMIIQSKYFGVHVIALSLALAAFFALVYIMSDQTERYYIKVAENERLRIKILLSQIQPHFLFNSLTVIKHLCATDPIKAENGIGQFIDYLRHNMDSLTKESPIEFEKELEHVRGYLALQELRFGKDLTVEYDLEVTDFRMPALTLQPLVENAVSYGVRKKESGEGTVRIITRKNNDFIDVIVEDDGPGFVYDPSLEDKDARHVGLRNVRERVEDILGGELIIDSQTGRGTRAVVRLRQER